MHGDKACAASEHERNPTDWLNPCGNTSSQNESKRKERTVLNNHSGEMGYESALFTSAVKQHEQFGVCLKENCERTKAIDEGNDARKKLMDKGDDLGMQPMDQASTLSEGEVENLEQKDLSLTRMINPTDQASTSSYQQDSYREVNSSEQNAINLEEKEKKVLEIVNAGISTQVIHYWHNYALAFLVFLLHQVLYFDVLFTDHHIFPLQPERQNKYFHRGSKGWQGRYCRPNIGN